MLKSIRAWYDINSKLSSIIKLKYKWLEVSTQVHFILVCVCVCVGGVNSIGAGDGSIWSKAVWAEVGLHVGDEQDGGKRGRERESVYACVCEQVGACNLHIFILFYRVNEVETSLPMCGVHQFIFEHD